MTTLGRLRDSARAVLAAMDVQWGSHDWTIVERAHGRDPSSPAHEHPEFVRECERVLSRANALLHARRERPDVLPAYPGRLDREVARTALVLAERLRAARASAAIAVDLCPTCNLPKPKDCVRIDCPVYPF